MMAELDDRSASDPVRCAPWSRQHDVDPIGSAGTYDTVVLVEYPLPWPRDVSEIPDLAPICNRPLTRVLAVPAETDDHTLVTVWRRATTNLMAGTDYPVPAGTDLGVALSELVDDEDGAGELGTPAPQELLICGHGQRDRCCGSLGVRLLRTCKDRWPGVRVRRCSHTGGHRFAPTAVSLPAGRMWAYLDLDVLDHVVSGSTDMERLSPHYRGSMAFEPLAQIAERAALQHLGSAWQDGAAVAVDVSGDDDEKVVRLRWSGPRGDGGALARVGFGRVLPVPLCGSPIELATKTNRELTLRSFSRTA